jgi:hypothetical protein
MAIPGASDGQEVIRRGCITVQSNDQTSFDFTGGLPTVGDETDVVAANHIITILSIIWCEQNSTNELIYLTLLCSDAKHVRLLHEASLTSLSTYIWSEKIVLIGGDALKTTLATTGNVDVSYTYLDQDWS